LIEAKEITIDNLVEEVKQYHDSGYRFVTTTGVDLGNDKLDIIYHFEKDLQMEHLRLTIDKDTVAPSVSSIYFCAVLAENELQDMFGIKFEGLAIDYKGKFLLGDESPVTPLLNVQVSKKEEGGSNG
jgi:NADH:ubiquinone oxidoreductase subunit C